MTSSLITVIVGITPSLGQSYFTFLTQLSGTGIGAIYGLIIVVSIILPILFLLSNSSPVILREYRVLLDQFY